MTALPVSNDLQELAPPVPMPTFNVFSGTDSCPSSPAAAAIPVEPYLLFSSPPELAPISLSPAYADTAENPRVAAIKKEERRRSNSEEERRRATRAENNRKYARDSRERRNEYIKRLKVEVRGLRQEVDFYRTRLSRYELIERHRSAFGYEFYTQIAHVTAELSDMHSSSTGEETQKAFVKRFDQFMEERRTAMEQLSRTIVEITASLPQRFLFWASENNLLLDPEKMSKATGGQIPIEYARTMIEIMQNLLVDRKQYNETLVFFAASSARVRGLVKELIGSQRHLQEEMKRVNQFIFRHFMPGVDMPKVQRMAQFVASLKLMPQLSDSAMYQLTQADFGMATSLLRNRVATEEPGNLV